MILANIGVLHRTILANIGCWQWASILGQHCTNVIVMLGQCIGVDIGESILGRYCANICPILGQCTGVDIGEAILGRYCANIFLMLGQCTEFRYLGLDIVIYCIHIRAMPGQCIANEFNYQPILISSYYSVDIWPIVKCTNSPIPLIITGSLLSQYTANDSYYTYWPYQYKLFCQSIKSHPVGEN